MARDYSKERRRVRTVRVGDHDIDKEIRGALTLYAAEVTESIDAAGASMVKKLVNLTRRSAPRASGEFAKSIASKTIKRPSGNVYIWYVKRPHHRITHLLVHGHATRDGGRTKADPFLHNALDQVLPEYEAAVKEALKND